MPRANVADNAAYTIEGLPGQPPFWVRGKEEEWTVKEQAYYNKVHVEPGDIVLDIGAHIGCSARWFLQRGAAHVVCFEPMPSNVEILRKNAEGLPIIVMGEAIVNNDEPTITMYTPNTKFSTVHSYIQKKGRTPTVVPARNFVEVVEFYKPQVLKMDTEGGELTLVEQFPVIFPYVRSVAMEVHYTTDDAREKAHALMDVMAQAYDYVQAPRYLDKNWNTDIVIWERR